MSKPWLRASIPIIKPIVYLDMDGVLCDWQKRNTELRSQGFSPRQCELHPQAFRDLEPIEGAIDAWNTLQDKFETYILSTAMWSNPNAWTDKRLWVEKFLGNSGKKKLILSHNKGLLKGEYLVDDRIANGVSDFSGKHIHFGSEEFPDWKSVLHYLQR